MAGFGRMHKISRRAGRGEGGRHLAGDMPGFAHAGNNDPSGRIVQHPDGPHKVIAQFGRQLDQSVGFGPQDSARQSQHLVVVEQGGFICGAGGWVCGHGLQQRYD